MSVMHFAGAVIMVFAKAPIPGEVKTRLIPSLGEKTATVLHGHLVRHTLTTAVDAGLCPVQLWCAPDMEHRFFKQCEKDFGVTLYAQHGSDLGGRMAHAFDTALHYDKQAVIIGSDCPMLTGYDLERALTALNDGFDAVLGPAEDGGYVLIGLSRYAPALFENIPWGTSRVLALTRERFQQLQWSAHELPTHRDVDRPEDLEHPMIQKMLHTR